jgi:hypothetical protein
LHTSQLVSNKKSAFISIVINNHLVRPGAQ